ncbi:MAG: APC family permease, partial [Hyphomicrobiales bacterium]
LLGLLVAAVVAYCNATSSARLAALYPESGGTYVYGQRRLGTFWGYLAGWAFVVGKTASCAAIALTVGSYLWPEYAHAIAVLAVAALTTLNYFGVQKAAWATKAIVAFTLLTLAVVVAVALFGEGDTGNLELSNDISLHGVLQAAGLLFFAFAGYARIATLGEEVRDPARAIPRAITIALAVTLAVYAAVAGAALFALGPDELASADAPLVEAVRAADAGGLAPLVRAGAACAALGSLLALILGVSRTSFAMARDGHLPRVLAAVHPRYQVPYRTEIVVGVVVAVLAATVDLRSAIGFSSFGVLTYYGIANASAFTLGEGEHPPWRGIPVLGAVGCGLLAFSLPGVAVVTGCAVLAIGLAAYVIRAGLRRAVTRPETGAAK